jgi:NitT/TauT family transport system substrate-binding protein
MQKVAAKRTVLVAISLMGLVATLFSSVSCQKGYSGPVESVSLGVQSDQTATEVYVAQEKGFFTQNGLNVTVTNYETGLAAVNALQAGEIELAGAAEFALARKALDHQAISTIAVANKIESFELVGRRDRGIKSVNDLQGKRIGLPLRTVAEFYLSRFLELHGVSLDTVALIDMLPSQLPEALGDGTIDAFVFIQPIVNVAEKEQGTNAISWEIQSSQVVFGMFIGNNDWITAHGDIVMRFLEAIEQANEYIAKHPDEAKTILKTRFNYTDEFLELVWPQNDFSLSLDQSLIAAMEDEARWMISNNMTSERRVPLFNEYICEDALKAIEPEGVNIIR